MNRNTILLHTNCWTSICLSNFCCTSMYSIIIHVKISMVVSGHRNVFVYVSLSVQTGCIFIVYFKSLFLSFIMYYSSSYIHWLLPCLISVLELLYNLARKKKCIHINDHRHQTSISFFGGKEKEFNHIIKFAY